MKTHHPELANLADRLEKLERQHRHLRAWAVSGLLLAGAVLLAQSASVGHAQPEGGPGAKDRLIVRDKDGAERAWLGMGKDGPGLFLCDPERKSQAEFTLSKGELVLR